MTATRPKRPLSRLAERLIGRLLFARTPLQPALVERMRREAAALDAAPANTTDMWDGLRTELREHLRAGDPAEFLHWGPVAQTMVMRSHRRAAPELAELRAQPDWRRRWRSAIRETSLGRPRPFPRYPWSSGNLIYQAYHLYRFEQATGRSLATMRTIVEFGGGYGRHCQLIHHLGFSGTYVIFDLPEVEVLQRFYLRHVGVPVSESTHEWPARGVVTVADLAKLRALLRRRPSGDSAFLAVGSLSEAPVTLRDSLLAEVASFDAFLFFYTRAMDSLDNRAYFASWRAALREHEWHDLDIPHLAKAASYLFGHRPNDAAPLSRAPRVSPGSG